MECRYTQNEFVEKVLEAAKNAFARCKRPNQFSSFMQWRIESVFLDRNVQGGVARV